MSLFKAIPVEQWDCLSLRIVVEKLLPKLPKFTGKEYNQPTCCVIPVPTDCVWGMCKGQKYELHSSDCLLILMYPRLSQHFLDSIKITLIEETPRTNFIKYYPLHWETLVKRWFIYDKIIEDISHCVVAVKNSNAKKLENITLKSKIKKFFTKVLCVVHETLL